MKTPVLTILFSLIILGLPASCAYLPDVSGILPDKKSEYRKSESMPDLEIPPDLTADAINDSMNIPNEAPVTLSDYKNPRGPAGANPVSGNTETGEQWLSLSRPIQQLWPSLLEFMETEEYPVDLNDEELGVLETAWSEAETQAGLQYRYKYKIFAEPGETDDNTVLIINQARQTRIDAEADWLDQDKDQALERQFSVELARFLEPGTVSEQPATETSPAKDTAVSTPGAAPAGTGQDNTLQVVDAGDGKMYLAIPETFENAWKNTGVALKESGLEVTDSDPDKGIYQVTGDLPTGKKKGLVSRMAFWRGNQDALLQISLTDAGNKTELIVVNEDNEWMATEDAARILSLIRDRYPQSP